MRKSWQPSRHSFSSFPINETRVSWVQSVIRVWIGIFTDRIPASRTGLLVEWVPVFPGRWGSKGEHLSSCFFPLRTVRWNAPVRLLGNHLPKRGGNGIDLNESGPVDTHMQLHWDLQTIMDNKQEFAGTVKHLHKHTLEAQSLAVRLLPLLHWFLRPAE